MTSQHDSEKPLLNRRETDQALTKMLAETPPSEAEVRPFIEPDQRNNRFFTLPRLQLPCRNCRLETSFECASGQVYLPNAAGAMDQWRDSDMILWEPKNVSYLCKNCDADERIYALMVGRNFKQNFGTVKKIGQSPPYGVKVHSKVRSLVGSDQELFDKGLRCESLGFGVGAYAYYRQIVEGNFQRMIEQIARVVERGDTQQPELLERLRAAKQETQFRKAVEIVADVTPEAIRIRGHNPLKLLHSALSEELHVGSDASCLERAHAIRMVLSAFAERVALALRDEHELDEALKVLHQRRAGQS